MRKECKKVIALSDQKGASKGGSKSKRKEFKETPGNCEGEE